MEANRGGQTKGNKMELTKSSLETFLVYANDARNWSGNPYVSGGNITCTKEMRGNLSDLVKKDLIEILTENELSFIVWTEAGAKLAASHGVAFFQDAA
jgi:hypothetical protein